MRPLRIGYICADVDIPILGHEGCSVKIREFTDALAEAGHDVFVLCSWLGESKVPISMKARVHVIEPSGLDEAAWNLLEREEAVENGNLERDLRSLLINYWLGGEGAEIIEREQPDVLFECYSLFGYAGGEVARRLGIPFVLEVNAPLVQEQAGYIKFPFRRTADALEPEILCSADVVVGVSEWVRDFVVARGAEPERVHAIANGVGEHFCAPVDGAGVRTQLGLENARVVGFVGSFHWWHDVTGLLEAFELLLRDDDDVRLLLVGDGPERAKMQTYATGRGLDGRVVFTGNVAHELVPQYIAAMDVAVAPFRAQLEDDLYGSPMKLFEYMAVGTPCVSTAFGQITEIVEHDRTGWLYPPGDVPRLAEGLRALLYDPERAARIGAASRSTVIEEVSWKAVSARILELAEPLIDRSRSAVR